MIKMSFRGTGLGSGGMFYEHFFGDQKLGEISYTRVTKTTSYLIIGVYEYHEYSVHFSRQTF